METSIDPNHGFIRCWTEILVPKWINYRHILPGNGEIHSRIAFEDFEIGTG